MGTDEAASQTPSAQQAGAGDEHQREEARIRRADGLLRGRGAPARHRPPYRQEVAGSEDGEEGEEAGGQKVEVTLRARLVEPAALSPSRADPCVPKAFPGDGSVVMPRCVLRRGGTLRTL